MATKLDKSLKRELEVNGELYMLTISPEGMKLVPKGKRKGHELTWKDLIRGQAALAVALNASLNLALLGGRLLRNRKPSGRVGAPEPARNRSR